MRFNNQIKTISSSEIETMLWQFKAQKFSHIEERQHSQINEGYMQFLEEKIEELNKLLERKAA